MAKDTRKLVVFGECPKCKDQVTLANKRKWWKEKDGTRRWYHWDCIKEMAAALPLKQEQKEEFDRDEMARASREADEKSDESYKGAEGPGTEGSDEAESQEKGEQQEGKNGKSKKEKPSEESKEENGEGKDDMDELAKILKKHLKQDSGMDEKKVKELIEQQVQREVGDRMEDAKEELKKQLSKTVTIEYKRPDTQEIGKIENPHKLIKKLLYHVTKGNHVYLHGPVGGGKSTGAMHVAKILSREFGYISLNPQTPESRILGYMDAGGTYRESVFRQRYEKGGVMCIDEMDNASAQLLTTLNSMLENGLGAFPDKMIEKHKDFCLVSTGNTNGRGANAAFPDRRSFDQAFAERFVFLEWPYDLDLEEKIALSINAEARPWIDFVWKLRDHCEKHFKKLMVSPRATFKGASYLLDDELKIEEIAESCIFKGYDRDSVKSITNAVPFPEIPRGKKKAKAGK